VCWCASGLALGSRCCLECFSVQAVGCGVDVLGVEMGCGGVGEEGGIIIVVEVVGDAVALVACLSHIGDSGLREPMSVPFYRGAVSDEVGVLVDGEGGETELLLGLD